MSRGSFRALRTFAALAGILAAVNTAPAQQTGTLQGTIVQAGTSQPITGAQITIAGTRFGTLTNAQGRFVLMNVPAGSHTLQVQLIGYTELTREVTVTAGQVTVLNLEMSSAPIALQEVVVTGVAGVTSKAKLPFVVDQLRADNMPVPTVSAGKMIQGKVAGATVISGSGRPGAGQSILLRGPTSINATGRNQEPLYIVDGVILSGSFVDFDGLNIENVEIVKGAAAASLYGSRAANGVIHITTARGRDLGESQTRFVIRSEYGRNQLARKVETAKFHLYDMDDSKTKFKTGDGSKTCAYLECEGDLLYNTWTSFQVNPWPGNQYDNLGTFFRAGDFNQNSVALEGRSGNTNYLASFSNLKESGVMPGQEGFKRNTFRLNLDHGLFSNLQVNATAFFSRSNSDLIAENQTSPLFSLVMLPPVVNIGARDNKGRLNPWPDPNGEELNPLYVNELRRYQDERDRFVGSGVVRYSPTSWLSAEAGMSYDRLSTNTEDFVPKGFSDNWDGTPGVRPRDRGGYLELTNALQDATNAHLTSTFTRRFGELATRAQVRYLYEEQNYKDFDATGGDFKVGEIPRLGVTDVEGREINSYATTIKSEGFYLISNFDLRDRYVLDAQVRRDGSSLFGPEERWQTYFRLGGAWRLSEEEFFNIAGVNEFKLRYAYGTAGSKPAFAAQYEVYSVASGAPTPVTLGNRNLKPEFATEQEMGIDAVFLNRFDMTLTYAASTVKDQILRVPLAGYAGFSGRWENAGTLQSKTIELSLGGNIYQGDKFTWNSRVLFDRTRQKITELSVPCYTYGLPASDPQGFENAFYACKGEAVGNFYGIDWVKSFDQLPKGVDRNLFQKNDDGYIVYVGQGGSWKGDATNWGKTATIDGTTYTWGVPIRVKDENGLEQVRIGKAMPDFNWSLSNTMRYGSLTLYALVDASHGFNVYNLGRQWAIRDRVSPEMDQTGPKETWKPHGYYNTLYAANNLNSHFTQDGSFVKLREVSLRYNIKGEQLGRFGLGGVDRASIHLTGRNLKTWTDYTGYDPEVGFGGGAAGSAALNRVDAFQYPQFRTWTIGVELGF